MSGIRVQRLDHVHVYVRDRAASEAWFGEVLGLVRHHLPSPRQERGWPVLLSSDGGQTHIALFEAKEGQAKTGMRTVAFRIDGEGFLAFLERLDRIDLRSPRGCRLTPRDYTDHGVTFTVYFADPDGNRFEVNTYDYDYVRDRLAS